MTSIAFFFGVTVEIDNLDSMTGASGIGERRNADAAEQQHRNHQKGDYGFNHYRAVNTTHINEQSIFGSCIFYLPLQFFGNFHWHERADMRATRVANGKPSSEIAQRRKCEPSELAEYFPPVPERNRKTEHLEMGMDMQAKPRLPEDMRSFEMVPSALLLVRGARVTIGRDLVGVGNFQGYGHGCEHPEVRSAKARQWRWRWR